MSPAAICSCPSGHLSAGDCLGEEASAPEQQQQEQHESSNRKRGGHCQPSEPAFLSVS
eukprot:COSAG01_NODE_2845_length_6987_cov_19.830139_9_plen_58_part_00